MKGTVGAAGDTVLGRVVELARAEAAARGLAVLDVTVSDGRAPVVTVTVDVDVPEHGRIDPGSAPQEAVDIDVIAALSRALDAALAADRVVPEDATLEVSSPGIERPLETAQDLVRNLGRDVELTLGEDVVRGRLVAVESGQAAVVVDGQERRFPLDDLITTRLVLPW